jgi:hypothetical protein
LWCSRRWWLPVVGFCRYWANLPSSPPFSLDFGGYKVGDDEGFEGGALVSRASDFCLSISAAVELIRRICRGKRRE